ncbi:hypothetical protein INR49_018308 [Caranx melampygus]|nr:hypothetical protein INR49_018308 [Caranx melampygus]
MFCAERRSVSTEQQQQQQQEEEEDGARPPPAPRPVLSLTQRTSCGQKRFVVKRASVRTGSLSLQLSQRVCSHLRR